MTNTPTPAPPAVTTSDGGTEHRWWRRKRDSRADADGDAAAIEHTSWWAVALAWLAEIAWDLDDD